MIYQTKLKTQSTRGLYLLGASVALLLAGCGGGGDVSALNANRGHQIHNEGTTSEVRVMARAAAFDDDTDISTSGRAEVIYHGVNWKAADRSDPSHFVQDALNRAKQVSGCHQAVHTHSQNSIRGTHVMVSLSACPPLSRG